MDQAAAQLIEVDVVYATAALQVVRTISIAAGSSAREAVVAAALSDTFPDVDFAACALGVWGEAVPDEHRLAHGERVEIYRELEADPRAARMALAAEGRTMGKAQD